MSFFEVRPPRLGIDASTNFEITQELCNDAAGGITLLQYDRRAEREMPNLEAFGDSDGASADGELLTTRSNLFSTPLLVATLPHAQPLNDELKRVILAREAASKPAQRFDDRGWRSAWDLAEWGGAPVHRVLAFVRAIVDPMTVDRSGKHHEIAWRVACRAHVNRHGHSTEFQTNPGALWSASYHVDDGGSRANPQLGGEFEVQDPRGVATVMYAPYLTFAGEDGAALGEAQRLMPRAGMAIVYPSWLSQGVRPYLGAGERIWITINFGLAAV